MHRSLLQPLFASILICSGLLTGGCASIPGASSTQTSRGEFATVQQGNGLPVVIFESGLGDDLSVWERVLPETAKFSTSLAYSRAGYRGSKLALGKRTGDEIVDDLRAVLTARQLKPPYVLVGHSLGGLYLQLFARLYPTEVAGLVLVDTTHPEHLERMRRESPAQAAIVQTLMIAQVGNVRQGEFLGSDEIAPRLRQAGPAPRCPVVMLSALRPAPLEGEKFIAFKLRLHRELAAEFPRVEHWEIADSGHYIQKDRPDMVVKAVQRVTAPAKP